MLLEFICSPDVLQAKPCLTHSVFKVAWPKSQLPHKFANLIFTVTNIKNKLTDLCGDGLLRNDVLTTVCEIKVKPLPQNLSTIIYAPLILLNLQDSRVLGVWV